MKQKNNINLMNLAPRCRAASKRTGNPCQAPAVKGHKVCRFHGAGGGAPSGKRNGNFRHGCRTKEAMAEVASINEMVREYRKEIESL